MGEECLNGNHAWTRRSSSNKIRRDERWNWAKAFLVLHGKSFSVIAKSAPGSYGQALKQLTPALLHSWKHKVNTLLTTSDPDTVAWPDILFSTLYKKVHGPCQVLDLQWREKVWLRLNNNAIGQTFNQNSGSCVNIHRIKCLWTVTIWKTKTIRETKHCRCADHTSRGITIDKVFEDDLYVWDDISKSGTILQSCVSQALVMAGLVFF